MDRIIKGTNDEAENKRGSWEWNAATPKRSYSWQGIPFSSEDKGRLLCCSFSKLQKDFLFIITDQDHGIYSYSYASIFICVGYWAWAGVMKGLVLCTSYIDIHLNKNWISNFTLLKCIFWILKSIFWIWKNILKYVICNMFSNGIETKRLSSSFVGRSFSTSFLLLRTLTLLSLSSNSLQTRSSDVEICVTHSILIGTFWNTFSNIIHY